MKFQKTAEIVQSVQWWRWGAQNEAKDLKIAFVWHKVTAALRIGDQITKNWKTLENHAKHTKTKAVQNSRLREKNGKKPKISNFAKTALNRF